MRGLPILSALSVLAFLSLATSCVAPPRTTIASPPPSPVRIVAPPAPAAPVVLPTDWRDWPQTPGDWRYQSVPGGSMATFGTSTSTAFAIQCVKPAHGIVLIRYVPTGGPVTILTSSLSRVLSFYIDGDPPGGSVVTHVPANDPLLDAVGFSRGRFVVEQAGAPPLVLPAWAEVERVVEDCRG